MYYLRYSHWKVLRSYYFKQLFQKMLRQHFGSWLREISLKMY